MRAPYTQLYLHLVWSTWDRLPLISEAIEANLHNLIAARCHTLKCTPLAVGGTVDHVHLLVRLHTTVSVAELMKQVKGSSSHAVNKSTAGEFFKWQGAYGAFTIGKKDVPTVKAYIEAQKQRHATRQTIDELEQATRSSDVRGD